MTIHSGNAQTLNSGKKTIVKRFPFHVQLSSFQIEEMMNRLTPAMRSIPPIYRAPISGADTELL
jgi:hypothetical protein